MTRCMYIKHIITAVLIFLTTLFLQLQVETSGYPEASACLQTYSHHGGILVILGHHRHHTSFLYLFGSVLCLGTKWKMEHHSLRNSYPE